MANKRVKTGERRKRRQPFKLDGLPEDIKQHIIELRNVQGLTWKQIEEASEEFVPWSDLLPRVREQFPESRLPDSSLQRWYDVRIEQVQKDILSESRVYEKFAKALAGKAIDGDDEAVINAMRNEVFAMARTTGAKDRMLFTKGLNQLTLALTRIRRIQLQKKRTDLEMAKIDAERARAAAEAGDPREMYLAAAQDILKKLRTRKDVRAALDPINQEIVQEIANGAEAFAKRAQTAAA
jgi:hypothetical protein